jgi:putative Ca2+/H+ antiporter (TMEM165/GDT1 family)
MSLPLEAFGVSTGAVFLGEIGDKTQLLALLLASRFRRPLPVIAGILIATLANHALAVYAGRSLNGLLDPAWLPWIVGLSFIAVGVWALVPDRVDEQEAGPGSGNVLWISTLSFFLAEIGDKTQLATAVLGARYDLFLPVLAGTTGGMLLADVPVVLLGGALAARLPLRPIRWAAAGLFILLGLLSLSLHGRLAVA